MIVNSKAVSIKYIRIRYHSGMEWKLSEKFSNCSITSPLLFMYNFKTPSYLSQTVDKVMTGLKKMVFLSSDKKKGIEVLLFLGRSC